MELQEAYSEIRAEGAELVAVSVDGIEDSRLMAEHAGAEFPVLSDAGQTVARAYGVFDLLGDGLSAPAVFILDGELGVLGGYVGQDINDRVTADSILEFLRQS